MPRPRWRGNGEETLRRSSAPDGTGTQRRHALLEDHQRKRKAWNAVVQQNPRTSALADRTLHPNAEVSLNGSPTVSPITVASCSGVPFCLRSTSTIFFALSHAPPALAMKMA